MKIFLKTYLFGFLMFFDRFIPLFSKDSFFSFSLTEKIITPLPVNNRRLGMQYWCEFNGDVFVSRFNSYLSKKKTGFLIHNWPEWNFLEEINLPDSSFSSPRYINGHLHVVKKEHNCNKIIDLQTGVLLGYVPGTWFDVFQFKGVDYLISSNQVFFLKFDRYQKPKIREYLKLNIGENLGECSVQELSGKLYLIARVFKIKNNALGSYLNIFETENLIDWQDNGKLFSIPSFGKSCLLGVGFPTLRAIKGNLVVFFTGYWGWHLFLPHTFWSWYKQSCRWLK